jgi:drug/metabolite transporter (DMT)-like permease
VSRRRFYAIGFGALVLFDTATQVVFKLATRQTGEFAWDAAWFKAAALNPWVYLAIAGYVCAFITWMTLLEHAPVGPAFAASHLEVVTVLVVSVPLFGERLAPLQLVGAASIVMGIILLSLSESKHAHA